jgi:choline dehydrogenase
MLFVRGNRADYDHWAKMGCTGWSYADTLHRLLDAAVQRGRGDTRAGEC